MTNGEFPIIVVGMVMSLREEFLGEVAAFVSASGLTKTAFGQKAVNDPKFVFDLEAGRSPSATMIDRIRQFIADNPISAPPSNDNPKNKVAI